MNAELVKETKGETMRKLTDAGLVFIGLAIIMAFTLGLVCGAKVEHEVNRNLSSEVR